MAILLNNQEQEHAITPKDAVDALESGLRQLARGDATRRPRIDNFCPTSRPDEFFCFSSMEGVVRDPGYYALRIKPDVISWPVVNGVRRRETYNTQPGLYGGLVFLFRVDNGELLAILNDGFVQHGQPEERARIPAGPTPTNRHPHARYVDCIDWETGVRYVRARVDEVTALASSSFGAVVGEGAASAGIQGLQFATVAGRIYERAVEQGLGTLFPAELFLQDIPT
ncbi:MAG: hypothetical protein GEU73_00845 [Chloroflexi bacterium]|nr:hypothetical protein [Chloroflexota bacterium]